MHEEGFRKGLTRVVNDYCRAKGHLKEKDDNLAGEDIREGLTAIVSVRLREPQFEGQTKSKLGNASIRSLVERATNEKLAEWLEENPTDARKIVTKCLQAQKARLGRPTGSGCHPPEVGPRRSGTSRQIGGLHLH